MEGATAGQRHGEYTDPVRRLLAVEGTFGKGPTAWPDYSSEFGLGPEHVDDLIRMACDEALSRADADSTELWAPMHAWRALGQLRAERAVPPLLALMVELDDDDAAVTELPDVFGLIGPAAIPHLARFLADPSSPTSPARTAIAGIKEIAARHPECRTDCIHIVARLLAPDAGTDPTNSGFAVSALIDMAAVEVIDLIRDAFRRNAVDIAIAGDLEDVEIELGLRQARSTPAPHYLPRLAGRPPGPDADIARPPTHALPRHEKVGRNDPCPCGSGKKYKKCCLQ
jgi:hypothetical protein